MTEKDRHTRPETADDEKRYPTLSAHWQADREEHIRRAMEKGLSREEAQRHVDEAGEGAGEGGEPKKQKAAAPRN